MLFSRQSSFESPHCMPQVTAGGDRATDLHRQEFSPHEVCCVMEVCHCVKARAMAGGETLEEDRSFLLKFGGASNGSILTLPMPVLHSGGCESLISPSTPPEVNTEEVVYGQGRGAALRWGQQQLAQTHEHA